MGTKTDKEAGFDEVLVFVSSPSGKSMFFEGRSAELRADRMYSSFKEGKLTADDLLLLRDMSNFAVTGIMGYSELDGGRSFEHIVKKLPAGVPPVVATPVVRDIGRIINIMCLAAVKRTRVMGRPGPPADNPGKNFGKVCMVFFFIAIVLAIAFFAAWKYGMRTDFDAGVQSGKGQAETQGLPGAPGRGK